MRWNRYQKRHRIQLVDLLSENCFQFSHFYGHIAKLLIVQEFVEIRCKKSWVVYDVFILVIVSFAGVIRHRSRIIAVFDTQMAWLDPVSALQVSEHGVPLRGRVVQAGIKSVLLYWRWERVYILEKIFFCCAVSTATRSYNLAGYSCLGRKICETPRQLIWLRRVSLVCTAVKSLPHHFLKFLIDLSK